MRAAPSLPRWAPPLLMGAGLKTQKRLKEEARKHAKARARPSQSEQFASAAGISQFLSLSLSRDVRLWRRRPTAVALVLTLAGGLDKVGLQTGGLAHDTAPDAKSKLHRTLHKQSRNTS